MLIETTWTSANKEYYLSKGYTYTHTRDKLMVKIKDLPCGSHVKIPVVCDYCGNEFYSTKLSLNRSDNNCVHACCNCKSKKMAKTKIINNADKQIQKALKISKEKGYILLTTIDDYKGAEGVVRYICPKHGECESILENFIHGHGCKLCRIEYTSNLQRNTYDKIKQVVESINNNRLISIDYYKNSCNSKLNILCGACGKNIFTTSFTSYKHSTQRCLYCTRSISSNELKIKNILDKYGINYIREKSFPDCKDKGLLLFDFYLPDYNKCFEFDGEQHYNNNFDISRKVSNPEASFEYRKRHDKIKDEYCKSHNISLIRIPYWEQNHLEEIITKELIIFK